MREVDHINSRVEMTPGYKAQTKYSVLISCMLRSVSVSLERFTVTTERQPADVDHAEVHFVKGL